MFKCIQNYAKPFKKKITKTIGGAFKVGMACLVCFSIIKS